VSGSLLGGTRTDAEPVTIHGRDPVSLAVICENILPVIQTSCKLACVSSRAHALTGLATRTLIGAQEGGLTSTSAVNQLVRLSGDVFEVQHHHLLSRRNMAYPSAEPLPRIPLALLKLNVSARGCGGAAGTRAVRGTGRRPSRSSPARLRAGTSSGTRARPWLRLCPRLCAEGESRAKPIAAAPAPLRTTVVGTAIPSHRARASALTAYLGRRKVIIQGRTARGRCRFTHHGDVWTQSYKRSALTRQTFLRYNFRSWETHTPSWNGTSESLSLLELVGGLKETWRSRKAFGEREIVG
jgi:hypothetical protein